MKKIMLINAVLPEETRIAIIEKGVLEELYVERLASENIVGNIYSGKIVNIEPGIQAAFVDFGIGRNGFLHISDVDPGYFEGGGLIGEIRTGDGTLGPMKERSAPRGSQRSAPREDREERDRPRSGREGDQRGRRDSRPDHRSEERPERRPENRPERPRMEEDRRPVRPIEEPDDEPVRESEDPMRDERGGKRRRRGRGRGRGRDGGPVDDVRPDDELEKPISRSLPDLEDYRIEDDDELHEEPVYREPPVTRDLAAEEPLPPIDDEDDFGMGLFESADDDDDPPLAEPDALYRRTEPDDEEEDFGSGLYGRDDDEDEEDEEEDDEDEALPLEEEDADPLEPQAREVRYDDEDLFDHLSDQEPMSPTAATDEVGSDSEPGLDGEGGSEKRGRRRRRRGRRGRRRPGDVESVEGSIPPDVDDEEGIGPLDEEIEPEVRPVTRPDWAEREPNDRARSGERDRSGERGRSNQGPRPRVERDRGRDDRDRVRDDRDREERGRVDRGLEDDEPRMDEDRGGRSRQGRDFSDGGDRPRGRRPERGGRDDRRGGGRRPMPQQRWVDPRRPRERPPIQEIFKRGQEVLVQVIKEGIGNKGPTLTTYVSIPGRSLVAMPGLDRVGVSRKIEDTTERRRLRDIMNDLDRPANVGFIVRTAGVDQTAEELERDLQYLSRLWEVVIRRIRAHNGPTGAYQESDVIIRTIRDIFNDEIDTIWIDERGAYERAREFMRMIMPDYVDRVRYYDEALPMFNKFHIEEEIVRIQQRTVPLEKGGSIVIEQTEALVAIDVNSGTFRAGEGNAEETAYQMNMAAAKEIARQLRLRDLGGVIVNDFIDMREERHRRSVENTLRDAVARDRAKTKVLRMSAFGMIEMTRQRIRPSLKRHLYRECPMCTGTGHVKTIESMSIDCMRLLIYLGQSGRCRSIQMIVDIPVAEFLNNEKRKTLAEIEDRWRVNLNISGRAMRSSEEVEIHCYDAQDREMRIDVDHLMIRGTVDR